jgi:hypothetical protein
MFIPESISWAAPIGLVTRVKIVEVFACSRRRLDITLPLSVCKGGVIWKLSEELLRASTI